MPKKNKYKIIPYFFIIFFSTFIIVDILYIYIAGKTWRGLATENGYQKGLQYNQTIAAIKEQKELGWVLAINYQSIKNKVGNLQIRLLDQNKKTISDANLTANIKRPIQEGKDFSLPLTFNSKNSLYESKIEFPLIGQWEIEIIAKKGDKIYQDVKRLIIQ